MSKDDDVAFTIGNVYSDKHNGNNDGLIVVKQEDIKQLNDPSCKHINMQRDESDTIGDRVAWKCPD